MWRREARPVPRMGLSRGFLSPRIDVEEGGQACTQDWSKSGVPGLSTWIDVEEGGQACTQDGSKSGVPGLST